MTSVTQMGQRCAEGGKLISKGHTLETTKSVAMGTDGGHQVVVRHRGNARGPIGRRRLHRAGTHTCTHLWRHVYTRAHRHTGARAHPQAHMCKHRQAHRHDAHTHASAGGTGSNGAGPWTRSTWHSGHARRHCRGHGRKGAPSFLTTAHESTRVSKQESEERIYGPAEKRPARPDVGRAPRGPEAESAACVPEPLSEDALCPSPGPELGWGTRNRVSERERHQREERDSEVGGTALGCGGALPGSRWRPGPRSPVCGQVTRRRPRKCPAHATQAFRGRASPPHGEPPRKAPFTGMPTQGSSQACP